jgi:hypothetical protein
MKKQFLTFFAIFVCCTPVWSQTDSIAGVWASKELSPQSGYPLWVFEITEAATDSLTIRVAPESDGYTDAYRSGAFSIMPSDGKLRFVISTLQLNDNDKVKRVSAYGVSGTSLEYSGGAGSRLLKTLDSRTVQTTNYFDLNYSSAPKTLSGELFYRSSAYKKYKHETGNPVQAHFLLTFEQTTREELMLGNMTADAARLRGDVRILRYLGPYTKSLVKIEYAKELKVANRLIMAGAILEGAGGAALLGMVVWSFMDGDMFKFKNNPMARYIAIGSAPLIGIGIGLHISGAVYENRIYKRFLREKGYFNMNINPGGAALSYNF